MAGMSLRTSVAAGASFNPTMPAAASTTTAPRAKSMSQRAYGISAGTFTGPVRAAVGSVSIGALSLGILIFIWWSLPR